MSLVTCSACERQIAADAASCPSCGKPRLLPIAQRPLGFPPVLVVAGLLVAVFTTWHGLGWLICLVGVILVCYRLIAMRAD